MPQGVEQAVQAEQRGAAAADEAGKAPHAAPADAMDAKFRTLFEQGTQLAGMLTLDGRVIEVNRLAAEGSGYTREDMVGRAFWDCGWWSPSPEWSSKIKAACRTAAVGRVFHEECPYYTADGSLRYVDLSIAPVRDASGNVLFLSPTGVDITQRVNAERALSGSREQNARQHRLYEAILTNTPDLAYVFDLQYRFIYANDVLLKMWGRTPEEAIGRTCLELGYEPWHAEMHNREIDQVMATRQPIRGQVPFNGAFGRRIYDYIFVPVLNAAGEVEAVAGTTRDVTEQTESAEKLRQLADQLSESDRRKTEFLAMLAHELRNPLAPLRNALHIMQHSPAGAITQQQMVALMQRQIGHMVHLIDDLLDISRISRGQISLQLARAEFGSIVRQSIETCTPMLEAAQQTLEVQLPLQAVALQADAVRLAQVISNLLNNASRYSPPGATIALRASTEGRELQVSVRDRGIGIPPQMLDAIFDMFVQVDRGPEPARAGLGIGLALVKSLIELHGGSVQAMSDGLGLGSEFVIRLPLSETETGLSNTTPMTAQDVNGHRILIVDDNLDAADSMAALLQLLGNQTQTAEDGHSALTAAASFAPELVLLDIGLPGIDGYETCRRLLQQAQLTRQTPPVLVALTGWGDPDSRRRSEDAGFSAHLVKPVAIDSLSETIASLLASPHAP